MRFNFLINVSNEPEELNPHPNQPEGLSEAPKPGTSCIGNKHISIRYIQKGFFEYT